MPPIRIITLSSLCAFGALVLSGCNAPREQSGSGNDLNARLNRIAAVYGSFHGENNGEYSPERMQAFINKMANGEYVVVVGWNDSLLVENYQTTGSEYVLSINKSFRVEIIPRDIVRRFAQ